MATLQQGENAPNSLRYVIAIGSLIWNEYHTFRELSDINCPKLFPMTTEGRIDADFECERAEVYFREDHPEQGSEPEVKTFQFSLI